MTILKFSNVKYYRGGGKCVRRLRLNQNYTIPIYLNSQQWLLTLSNEQLIKNLNQITKGKVYPSSTTVVKIIK